MKLTANSAVNYTSTKISCYIGYITQAIVINLAPIFFVIFSDKYGLDNASLGTLVLINFVTQIATDVTSVRLTSKLSMRTCAVLAHVFSCVGLLLLGILPGIIPDTFIALVAATLVYSVGGGLTEVVISPIVDAIPADDNGSAGGAKAAAMALLHSFYCWGQVAVVLISTLMLYFFGNEYWQIIPCIWALIPFFNSFAFARCPFPEFVGEGERMPLSKIVTSRLFIVAAILMVCSGASELTVAQWASMLAEKGLGISKVAGDILGPCAFAFCMGIGRIIYGILGAKLPLAKSILICSVLCVCSYLMISLSRSPVTALIGCSLCGISVSLMWPGVLSLTSGKFPNGGAAMFSVLAICGDTGCSLGPWLTGFVSGTADTAKLAQISVFSGMSPEQTALKTGILAAIIFPTIMIVAVTRFKSR